MIPVPAGRQVVARAVVDAETNPALDQSQWEAAKPAWSLRARPDVLATLYQIGFARSRPQGSPRSNAFGRRERPGSGATTPAGTGPRLIAACSCRPGRPS